MKKMVAILFALMLSTSAFANNGIGGGVGGGMGHGMGHGMGGGSTPAASTSSSKAVSTRLTRFRSYTLTALAYGVVAYFIYEVISSDLQCRATPGCKPVETDLPVDAYDPYGRGL